MVAVETAEGALVVAVRVRVATEAAVAVPEVSL
jgi:hypothetical protein